MQMTKQILKFPKNFLWGASSSAHQVEGRLHNNWTEWEARNAKRLADGAAKAFDTPAVNWLAIRNQAEDPQNYISGAATDHYHHYKKDFNLAKKLGHNVHRFSIEWSRVEPERGQFDEAAIEHYRSVISALRQRGIEPFVTLFHWTTPVWVSQQGDWYSEQTAQDFIAFVTKVVTSLGEDVRYWTTFNEPEVFCQMAYRHGYWPPEGRGTLSALRVGRRLVRTHRRIYQIIKSINPAAQVGASVHNIYIDPADGIISGIAAKIANHFANDYFVSGIAKYQDFIGLNYYFHMSLSGAKLEMSTVDPNDMGWGMYPEGIYHVLTRLQKYDKPIFITECGVADRDDIYRSWYIHQILRFVHRATTEGVDVRGFMYWSLTDNFEWDKGFWPRFGLVEIDYKTQKRTIRPSALEYAKVIKQGGVESER